MKGKYTYDIKSIFFKCDNKINLVYYRNGYFDIFNINDIHDIRSFDEIDNFYITTSKNLLILRNSEYVGRYNKIKNPDNYDYFIIPYDENIKYDENIEYDIYRRSIFSSYKYSYKISESMCILILIKYNNDKIKYIFNFINNQYINLDNHINQYNNIINNDKNNFKYYYINDEHYIYENKLYFISKNITYNLIDKSFSNKNLLISRSDFFKDIYKIYDYIDDEFINKYIPDFEIYLKYIKTGNVNNNELLKLFDVCLYVHDIDIEFLVYYIINNFQKENINLYLMKLNDFIKQKNILLDNYINE